MKPAEAYLFAYNAISLFGWGTILMKSLLLLSQGYSYSDTFTHVEPWLQIFQTTALLEIAHSLLRLVRSPLPTVLMQVYSRVTLVWLVLWKVGEARDSIGVPMILIAWSITEVIRYSFYALQLLGSVMPDFLVWARYSFFILLYPIGASGELFIMVRGLDEVDQKQHFSLHMPNALNFAFSFYAYLCFYMLSYIYGFPKLYLLMFSLRKKVLCTDSAKKQK